MPRHPNYSGKTWVDSALTVIVVALVTALLVFCVAILVTFVGLCLGWWGDW